MDEKCWQVDDVSGIPEGEFCAYGTATFPLPLFGFRNRGNFTGRAGIPLKRLVWSRMTIEAFEGQNPPLWPESSLLVEHGRVTVTRFETFSLAVWTCRPCWQAVVTFFFLNAWVEI